VKYFELQCCYLDFDGKVFNEVIDRLPIEKFHGAKRIDALEAFPLVYHLVLNTNEVNFCPR
jgi:hypothetical protein